ncbi:uncharacterized protein SAMN04489761_4515 [Tenacibaculum sp. MAR_2009_124]|uniref:TPM domain-containing protein n=1 Tax=Tenacibaculum sp. MAR_2009_124 TaxID=1250059 RepID=UPI000895A101|nr:TPM domain-containing protein [Tenacibaculum sp. MAR_2009_124]SED17505.1 uncharacterized protein SAMN04489761_4515 [Tenacibaculum sp. MAR_2009_124]
MKTVQYFLLIIICLNFSFCKTKTVQKENKKLDFKTIKRYKTTKENGTIINDYDFVFKHQEETELSEILYDYNIKTTNQIVVVTVDSIEPYNDLQKFAVDLATYWKIGNAEKDNGLVIVLCKPCRKVSIVTGYGTEKVLTDKICSDIIENTIIPQFKEGNYYFGIKKGIEEIIQKWE